MGNPPNMNSTAPQTVLSSKVYLILVRFLSVAGFATSVLACFSAYHTVSINEGPYVQDLFGIRCQDLTGDSREYCEASENTRYYTLWRAFGNFFSLQDWDSGVLCGERDLFHAKVPVTGDIATLTVGNLGNCSAGMAQLAAAFTILTCIFSAFLMFFITVLADSFPHGLPVISLSSFLTMTSLSAIIVYSIAINPLRQSPTFCQEQTLFDKCEQGTGWGFWFQVSTLIMSFLVLMVALIQNCTARTQTPLSAAHHSDVPFYKSLHFYVQLVRFSELVILVTGVASPFTTVRTSVPPIAANSNSTDLMDHAFAGHGGELETDINLWQGLFCHPFGARLFLWSVALNEQNVPHETFGECDSFDMKEVQMGYIMAMVTAITAMTFQKDARDMPLAYIIGFVMHFLSMVKLSWAIGEFMTSVYPGRKEIDPSYCSLWTSFVGQGATCSIDIGPGLILTATALGTVAVSFIGELVLQKSSDYGVGGAFRTLIGRLKQGRFSDLVKPASERVLSVGESVSESFEEDPDRTEDAPEPRALIPYKSKLEAGRDINRTESQEEMEPRTCSMAVYLAVAMMLLVVALVIAVSVVIVINIQKFDG